MHTVIVRMACEKGVLGQKVELPRLIFMRGPYFAPLEERNGPQ